MSGANDAASDSALLERSSLSRSDEARLPIEKCRATNHARVKQSACAMPRLESRRNAWTNKAGLLTNSVDNALT